MRLASNGVEHLLSVAVVRSDAEDVASLLTRIVNGLDSLVGGSDSLNGSVVHSGVTDLRYERGEFRAHGAHHVRRSKVAHDKLVLAGLNDLSHLVGDSLDTHLRLLVVRCDLWRGNHHTLFALILLLDATVEEEGNVRVLLRLCQLEGPRCIQLTSDVVLLHALLGEPLGEHVVHGNRGERNGKLPSGVVARHSGDELNVNGIAVMGRGSKLTRPLGTSTSMGLSSNARREVISRMRSER